MAMSLAIVWSWGEQPVSIMGQTSRCCMVCLMPQSQVSCSLENPHFNMFTRPANLCTQPVECLPGSLRQLRGVRQHRCTLASRGSSLSLHSTKRAAFAVVLMGSVLLMKVFRVKQLIGEKKVTKSLGGMAPVPPPPWYNTLQSFLKNLSPIVASSLPLHLTCTCIIFILVAESRTPMKDALLAQRPCRKHCPHAFVACHCPTGGDIAWWLTPRKVGDDTDYAMSRKTMSPLTRSSDFFTAHTSTLLGSVGIACATWLLWRCGGNWYESRLLAAKRVKKRESCRLALEQLELRVEDNGVSQAQGQSFILKLSFKDSTCPAQERVLTTD